MSENLTVLEAADVLREIEALIQAESFTRALERIQDAGRPGFAPAEMVRLHHLHGVTLYRLGRVVESAGRFRKSLEVAEACQDLVGQARALEEIAAIHYQERRLQEALGHYERALRLWVRAGDHEGEARGHRNLGNLLADMNENARALQEHSQARALYRQLDQPDELAPSIIHAASWQYQQGGLETALEEYRRGLEDEGCHHYLVLNNYSFLLMLNDQVDRALDLLTRAWDQIQEASIPEDDKALLQLNLGLGQAMQGNLGTAEEHLRRSAALLEKHPEARAVEIMLLANDKWLDRGLKNYLVIENGQKRSLAHLNLATVLARAGRPEEAEEQVRAGIELDRSAAYPYLAAGWVHLDRGDEKAATEAFRRARGMEPENEAYRQALDLVNPYVAMKVGRNDPCPCGSGKKFKKCHGAS